LGFTLVELIMFIVIMGVVAAAMVQAFSGTMRGSHTGKELTQAIELAQQRMEVIAGQRKRLGYASFIAGDYDPCQAPPAVVPPWSTAQFCIATAYTVASALSACGTGCSEITVTVTAPQGGLPVAVVTQVWNY
jgi:type II secretory pathway pseudopilin PulG